MPDDALNKWDYIIVGAGSAGCVLAERLSADPGTRVLLLEAGPEDRSPFIHMPMGAAKLFADPKHVWFFPTEAHDGIPTEVWIRGKVLGGSSSVNGMMYFRGQPQDYDAWVDLGAEGWGWSEMARAFRSIEGHELGADDVRGGSGPLGISVSPDATPFTEAFIKAGVAMGLQRRDDVNRPDQEGIGYATRTIRNGRRASAAQAFLRPARRRPNLRVITGALVERVVFEDRRAVGVLARVASRQREFRCHREVILSAGGLMSPQILERSGIGDSERLRKLGINCVVHSPGVGAHMLEHRLLMIRYDLSVPYSNNPELRGARLYRNILRYYLARKGPLAAGYGAVAAFVRALPTSPTPDTEILVAPAFGDPDEHGNFVAGARHGVQIFGYPLRSRSEGAVHIASADPTVPPHIRAGYLTDSYDRTITVAMHRFIRRWMARPELAGMVGAEWEPSRSLETDEDILAAFRTKGQAGLHACGTCRMGNFNDAVLDSKLNVRGVTHLRIVDGSVMPTMVSANTNGPIMAVAWRASEFIRESRP